MQKPTVEFKTWDEVDSALRRMGEIDIAVEGIQGDMTLEVNELKAQAETKAEGLKKERQLIEKAITLFCEERKDEFAKTRSRELTFGVVAYRVTTKIVIRSIKACVAAMEALKLDKYLRIEKKPDKEIMLNLDDNTLAKVGASRKTEDSLRIEPAMEKIKEAA
ncbi:MAG: host-nuclease inhibitor Gam family protein [Nitrospirae bacterium]|nr:host-nuclease inhibitor Gam family protein [Nitrospirota bacterium]